MRNLCKTCKNSLVIEGENFRNKFIKCHEAGEFIPFPVTRCSGFEEKNAVDIYDMQKIAWVLEVKKGTVMGFISPIDRKKKEYAVGD